MHDGAVRRQARTFTVFLTIDGPSSLDSELPRRVASHLESLKQVRDVGPDHCLLATDDGSGQSFNSRVLMDSTLSGDCGHQSSRSAIPGASPGSSSITITTFYHRQPKWKVGTRKNPRTRSVDSSLIMMRIHRRRPFLHQLDFPYFLRNSNLCSVAMDLRDCRLQFLARQRQCLPLGHKCRKLPVTP